MFDFSTVKRAPRYFMAGTGLTCMYYGYGTGKEEFISAYHPDIDAYHITFKDESGVWHDTEWQEDWPFFDKLFGRRERWQMYCSAMGDCARRAIEAGIEL